MAPEQAAIQTRRKEREDVVELLSLVYVSSACVCLRCCLSSYLPSHSFFLSLNDYFKATFIHSSFNFILTPGFTAFAAFPLFPSSDYHSTLNLNSLESTVAMYVWQNANLPADPVFADNFEGLG